MKLIDGKGVTMGRLASNVAKLALKGEEVRVFNCNEVIITGNFDTTKDAFTRKRNMIGHSQKGPKHHADSEKIVKRAIRGMLPNYREGRGKMALQRIKCFVGVPKEYEEKKLISLPKSKKIKFAEVREFTKQNGRN